MELYRIAVVGVLIAIVVSLGNALFHLVRDRDRDDGESSRKMARALTVRIGLSIALFALIMLGWYLGLIRPHGVGGH